MTDVKNKSDQREVSRLIFGIYPGMTGQEQFNTGPVPDEPEKTEQPLARLQSHRRPFLARSYVIYQGHGQATNQTLVDPIRYARDGWRLDLVLCYGSTDGDLAGWTRFVRGMAQRYGSHLDALQITEEANNPRPDTGGDGSSPNVL